MSTVTMDKGYGLMRGESPFNVEQCGFAPHDTVTVLKVLRNVILRLAAPCLRDSPRFREGAATVRSLHRCPCWASCHNRI